MARTEITRSPWSLAAFATPAIVALALPALAQFKLTPKQQAWVSQTLARMSLDEKVGALTFPVASGTFTNESSDDFQAICDNSA